MKELLPKIEQWIAEEKPFAMARVIQTWGSSPRPVGSAMLVSSEMEMAGSVSGGCVEGAVLKSALPLTKSGYGLQLYYGVADEEAWEVGLSCGGKIRVFAEQFPAYKKDPTEREAWEKLHHCLSHNEGCVWITPLRDGPSSHTLILPDQAQLGASLPEEILSIAHQAYSERKHIVTTAADTEYFIQVFPRKSQMIIIGAAHITVDLVNLANMYEFETIVIDPRSIFSQKTQFSTPPDQIHDLYPSEVLEKLPLDAYSYAVVLSHDPKIDDNALHILLSSEVAYIGALGSRKTHAKRIKRLTEAGFTEETISRIYGPVGVSIHAKTPKEIAMSIMAEVISVKNQYL
ncbi:MAG: XdhC family protein [Bacteroidota bacterium]